MDVLTLEQLTKQIHQIDLIYVYITRSWSCQSCRDCTYNQLIFELTIRQTKTTLIIGVRVNFARGSSAHSYVDVKILLVFVNTVYFNVVFSKKNQDSKSATNNLIWKVLEKGSYASIIRKVLVGSFILLCWKKPIFGVGALFMFHIFTD